MRIQVQQPVAGMSPGKIYDVPYARASSLIDQGLAVAAENTDNVSAMDLAVDRIHEDHGVWASVVEARDSVEKWGYLPSSQNGVWETVMIGGGTETLLTANTITHIVGGSGDSMDVLLQGHYLTAADDLVSISQTATLNGTTPVVLDTAVARVSRMYVVDGTVPTGPITVTVGSGGDVHCTIAAGDTQTEHCATSLDYRSFLLLDSFGATILGNNNAAAEVRLERKDLAGVWRPLARDALKGDSISMQRSFATLPVISSNSDLRLRVKCSAAGTAVGGWFSGWIAVDESLADDTPAPPA